MRISVSGLIKYLFSFFCIFLLLKSNVSAQDLKKFEFSVHSGYAIPLGQLGSHHGNDGGYGIAGLSSSAQGIWFFLPHFGFGCSVALTSITFDDLAYAQYKLSSRSEPAMQTIYLQSDNYRVCTISAGFYYLEPISDKFSFSAKLAGGLLWAQTPDQLYSASFFDESNYITYKITPSSDTKAMFQPGLTCEYKLFEQVCLSLNADYTIAVPGFPFKTSTSSYVRKLTFSYVNAMLGIDFRF
jgi:hypothetical protein